MQLPQHGQSAVRSCHKQHRASFPALGSCCHSSKGRCSHLFCLCSLPSQLTEHHRHLPGTMRCRGPAAPGKTQRPTDELCGAVLLFRDHSRGWSVAAELLGMQVTAHLSLVCIALVPTQASSLPVLCQKAHDDHSPQGCTRAAWMGTTLNTSSVGRQEGPGQAVLHCRSTLHPTAILGTPRSSPTHPRPCVKSSNCFPQ